MGASHWCYATPWVTDVRTSIDRLRAKVFETRDYVWDGDDEEDERPATIEDLLAAQEDEGTHSLLDLPLVSDTPETGAISPLSDEELLALFGTRTPTLDQTLTWAESGEVLRGPWEGAYVVVMGPDGDPQDVVLSGISGD